MTVVGILFSVKNQFKKMQKKIIILGAGESGVGAAVLAKLKGYNVFVSDGGVIANNYKLELHESAIDFEEGSHDMERILQADEVVKSPGISEKSAVVCEIRKQGIPIISEIELAFRYKDAAKIIAITGSNGKTTTTALVHHICFNAGLDCALVGNIGVSFAKQIAIAPKPLYIVEVSSFQLDDIATFAPNIAIITNITEDHLDRYDYIFQNYISSKFKIASNQTNNDILIYCADDEVTVNNLHNYPIKSKLVPITMNRKLLEGVFIENAVMHLKWKKEEMQMSINDFAVKGKHNQYNSMAASIAAVAIDIKKENVRESLQTFTSLAHRMEPVATIKGVSYINDSKATNVNSAWFALESIEQPTILILGGVDKGNDYNLLKELVKEKVKAIICLGLDNEKINSAFEDVVPVIVNTSSAEEAVKAAYHFAEKGDCVLLSPACASFDLFKNYEDRGDQFKRAVKNL
jgi:UDP-N-acetylmuramoylalanine--D-glutamate ligase